jgi:hypothetical protein
MSPSSKAGILVVGLIFRNARLVLMTERDADRNSLVLQPGFLQEQGGLHRFGLVLKWNFSIARPPR